MNTHSLNQVYAERLPEIENTIRAKANGNDDLKQEGLIGAYHALQNNPYGTRSFLLNKAKWQMVSYLRRGRSVDNGFYKRDQLNVFHYDGLPYDDGIFGAAVSNTGKAPVDEQAIFRVDLERFLNRLSRNEYLYVRYKTMDGMSDESIRSLLQVSFPQLYEFKRNIRKQIDLAFKLGSGGGRE